MSAEQSATVIPFPVSPAQHAAALHDPGGKSKPLWRPGATVTAEFSECGKYRYRLTEVWDRSLRMVMFLMMNPSVAGISHSDPTIMRTGRFARDWGFGSQCIGNMHAYRATDSKKLMQAEDPVGPLNDRALLEMALQSDYTVLAYGLPPKPLRGRADGVVAMLRDAGVHLKYLALTSDGTPRHPLYLKASCRPEDLAA
jgi:hypothetical protein